MKQDALISVLGFLLLTCTLPVGGQTISPEPDISIILDSEAAAAAADKGANPSENIMVATESPAPATEPQKPLRIINPVPLNSFALAMAQKAKMTFVPNPRVSGNVLGTFFNTDPLAMLEQAARANGYQLTVRKGVVELENAETRAAMPLVTYTRVLRYLRAPYVRDPGSPEASIALTGTAPVGGAGGGAQGGGGGGAGGGGQGGGIGGNPSSVTGSQAQRLTELFRGVLSKDAYLNYDQKTSTVVARDVDVNIAALDALISQLDVDKPNILTAVNLYEVVSSPANLRGINWGGVLGRLNPDDTITGATLNTTALSSSFVDTSNNLTYPGLAQTIVNAFTGRFTGNTFSNNQALQNLFIFDPAPVQVVLTFMNQRGMVESKARWFTVCEDNESGVANISRQQPIIQVQSSTQTNTGSVQFSYINIGAILRVTPQLRPGNLVRLQMRPELSNIVRFESAGGAAAGSRAPVIDTRTTELIISMPLGKTLVLGGLQNLQRREIANKVPFFGDLPLVGPALFSSKAKIAENRNLVLVVEPQLVDYNNIPEFDAANQHEQKHYKWKKEYGSASLQNVDSTIQEWGFGVGEGVKHGKNPVAPYAKPVNQKP